MRRKALLTSSRREGFGISGALRRSSARSSCGEADMKTEGTPFPLEDPGYVKRHAIRHVVSQESKVDGFVEKSLNCSN
jgi:hypothetical protein